MIPDTTLHGHTSFEWIEGGAFLIMHSEIDEPGVPSGVAIFGGDDSVEGYSMLYFDERGVSRIYEASFNEVFGNSGEIRRAFRNASQVLLSIKVVPS